MKKVYFTILCLWSFIFVYAQRFNTILNFEDRDGHKDSIVIGYDDAGSPFLDSIFDYSKMQTAEQIISSIDDGSAWAWVRWTTYIGIIPIEYPYYAKSYFLPTPQPNDDELLYYGGVLVVPADRLPVIVRWNKNEFSQEERSGTRISEIFAEKDTYGYECLAYDTYMSEQDSIIVYASCGVEMADSVNATMCPLGTYTLPTLQPSEYANVYMKRLFVKFAYRIEQSVGHLSTDSRAIKSLYDGQIIIKSDNGWFNMFGIPFKRQTKDITKP